MEHIMGLFLLIIGCGIGFLSAYYKLPWFISLVISFIVLSIIGLITVISTGV